MGIRTIRTLTVELRMRYGRATDTKVCMDFKDKSNRFVFFCNVLGILSSDYWRVTVDCSIPLQISQGHYGCYG